MSFIDTLEKVVAKASELLAGPIVPAVVDMGKSVLDLVEKSKEVVAETDIPKLETLYAELQPKVMAHADSTEAKLRGQA